MAGTDYLRTIRQQLTSQGWDTSINQVQNGIYLIEGKRSVGNGSEHGVVLVVTDVVAQVGTDHINFLRKERRNRGADKAVLAAKGRLTDEAERLTTENNIGILDRGQLESKSVSSNQSQDVIDSDIETVVAENIGTLATVGVGFGLTNALGTRLLMSDSLAGDLFGSIFILLVFLLMLFSGPILGAIVGLQIRERITDTRDAMVAAFASGFLGYVSMTVSGALLTVLFMPDFSNGGAETNSTSVTETGAESTGTEGMESELFEFTDLLLPLIMMAIPVGIVAMTVIYLSQKIRYESS